ncbi:hypothetical protein ACI2OX_00925 [Bacillus sp. N9]
MTTLRLAENQPADFPTAIGVKEFARLIEEKLTDVTRLMFIQVDN